MSVEELPASETGVRIEEETWSLPCKFCGVQLKNIKTCGERGNPENAEVCISRFRTRTRSEWREEP